MSTAIVMDRISEKSPRTKAKITGVFYLLTILMGVCALFLSGRLVVSGDAASTATNILAHESVFLLGFAADLISSACYIAVTALFYELFKPVNRSLSLLAAFFSLVGCTIGALSCVFHLAPLVVLGGEHSLRVFKVEQVQALALMFLKLKTEATHVGLVFFGFYCLLIGYLIFRSTFMPRILGVLMVIAGLGWLTSLSPPLADYVSHYVIVPGLLGEGSLTIFLLVRGVNTERWEQRASAARASTRT